MSNIEIVRQWLQELGEGWVLVHVIGENDEISPERAIALAQQYDWVERDDQSDLLLAREGYLSSVGLRFGNGENRQDAVMWIDAYRQEEYDRRKANCLTAQRWIDALTQHGIWSFDLSTVEECKIHVATTIPEILQVVQCYQWVKTEDEQEFQMAIDGQHIHSSLCMGDEEDHASGWVDAWRDDATIEDKRSRLLDELVAQAQELNMGYD